MEQIWNVMLTNNFPDLKCPNPSMIGQILLIYTWSEHVPIFTPWLSGTDTGTKTAKKQNFKNAHYLI